MRIPVPKYLYHRTSNEAYGLILRDGRIKSTGTPASCTRYQEWKFDKKGNDKWHCVFLGDSVDFTTGMTWGGDVVLKIRTKNLKGKKLDMDHNVSKWDYGRSFSYYGDIPISEIVETIIDKWHYL